jgi:hypothetical protein
MFNKIKKLAVSSESTAVYEFDVIEGRPSIVVRPATQANPAYLNAVLGEGKALARRGKRAMSVATLADNRANDRKLYKKFIVVKWETPALLDDGTAAVDGQIGEFLDALPDDLFDEFRAFCSEPANFRVEDDELVKN